MKQEKPEMLKAKIAPHIVEIIGELQNAGYEAYIVGGAVRDFLLNRNPKDYDLSCAATPEQIRRVFKRRHTMIIGRRFKLVHLFHEREIIEISTFRRRPSSTGAAALKGGKPRGNTPEHMIFRDNEYGSEEEDALRRDFTVNAVFYDPVHDKVKDFTGHGLADIKDGIVRTIGEPILRFEEDPVRILRAIKLVGQYGFKMDPETEEAVKCSLDLILHVSNSRLTLELEKILKSPYGDQIIEAFHKYGFLKRFLPWLEAKWNTPEREYMSKIWHLRNERVRSGEYRDSISLVMSLLALPFAETKLGENGVGGLWEYRHEIDYDLEDMLRAVMSPRAPTRRALAAAVRNLMLQTRMKEATGAKSVMRHPGYPHARELALIQNKLLWQIPDFEEIWPPARHQSSDFAPERDHQPQRRSRHGGRIDERPPFGQRGNKRIEKQDADDVEEREEFESEQNDEPSIEEVKKGSQQQPDDALNSQSEGLWSSVKGWLRLGY